MSIENTVAGISPYAPISQLDEVTNTSTGQLPAESTNQIVSSFEDILSNLVPGTGSKGDEINEEQLFSALIEERLTTLKGNDLASTYNEYFESHKSAMTGANGYVPIEDAAREALHDLTTEGLLSTEEAEEIHAQAFQAAQFDSNKGALYDSFGTTMAVTMVEMALQSSSAMMAKFDSGELEAGRLSFDYKQESDPAQFDAASGTNLSSNQTTDFVGGDGFLFKPVSEKNGNLVVLLPTSMSGQIANVSLVDDTGQVIERGDESGDFDDGRPLFRFDQAGGSYPQNIAVTVTMLDGSEKQYNIANPSQRYA